MQGDERNKPQPFLKIHSPLSESKAVKMLIVLYTMPQAARTSISFTNRQMSECQSSRLYVPHSSIKVSLVRNRGHPAPRSPVIQICKQI